MKKILGIVCSARKSGNCELMVKEIYRSIELSCKLRLLRLPSYNIKPCRGCYKCLLKEQRCIIRDDLYNVLESISNADALILAAPTYFLGAHSTLKCFVDRGLSFYPYAEKLWGKPSIGIAVAGIEGKEGSTLLGIENFLKFVLSDIKQTQTIYGALPGEALLNIKNKKIAQSLAKSLFGKTSKKLGPHCNLCGGDTFRFIDGKKVRCMLCSSSGTTEIGVDGKIDILMAKGKHQFFLTKEDVIRHKNWLISMKVRFKSMHKILKKVGEDYQQENSWIEP